MASGIYDKLIPILQQWNQQYNFVGSYYINIGDNTANTTDPSTTNWTKSLPYYQAIQAMGGEIGNHSYTHLINPPTTTFTAHTVGTTAAGSIQVTLDTVPSFFGITVGMVVSGLNIGANVTLPGAAGEAGAVANTMVTAVVGQHRDPELCPWGIRHSEQWGARRHTGWHDADLLSSCRKRQLPADGGDRRGQ